MPAALRKRECAGDGRGGAGSAQGRDTCLDIGPDPHVTSETPLRHEAGPGHIYLSPARSPWGPRASPASWAQTCRQALGARSHRARTHSQAQCDPQAGTQALDSQRESPAPLGPPWVPTLTQDDRPFFTGGQCACKGLAHSRCSWAAWPHTLPAPRWEGWSWGTGLGLRARRLEKPRGPAQPQQGTGAARRLWPRGHVQV